MTEEQDRQPTEEELELARKGEEMIAAAMADVRAPQSLREGIEHQRSRAQAPFWRRHRLMAVAAGAAAVALIAGVTAVIVENESPEPALPELYATAEEPPNAAAPPAIGGTPPVLDAAVGALEFPDWREKFAWRAVGRRDSDLGDRGVTTVYYRNPEGTRLSYAVADGRPLGGDPAGRRIEHRGDTYDVARNDRRTIVTWTQQGHTCVIVAPSEVPRSTLVDLASSRNV
jgi:hypothetical protein